MAKIRYLHIPPGRDDLYFRRKIPEDLRPLFGCGEFYKVPLGTKDPRTAEPLLAIANGEYEKKVAGLRETLKDQGAALSLGDAQVLVERYLTRRSANGFASGGSQAAFLLLELDDAVGKLTRGASPTARSILPEERTAHLRRIAERDEHDEFSSDVLSQINAEFAIRHRRPGTAGPNSKAAYRAGAGDRYSRMRSSA